MEAAPRCITIKVYRNKILLETKRYANPPKPAGDILDRLRDIQMVGDLRHGDLLLSASDMLGGAATYELHLKPGVISFDTSFLHRRLLSIMSIRLLLDHNAHMTDGSFR